MKRGTVFAIVLVGCMASSLHSQDLLHEGTWTGTRVRLARGGNNPQQQRISLEIKKAADPHTAWRPDKGTVMNATLISPQGRLQVSDLQLDNSSLSFSYRLETDVRCRLERQPDGAYQGSCLADGESRGFRVTLNPPKPTA